MSGKYSGILVAKGEPAKWSAETLLLRFVEENNADTVFILTGKALEQFRSCETWRAYEFTVNGSAVKKSGGDDELSEELEQQWQQQAEM